MEDETEFFLNLIKDKEITAILDSKQQRNATIYKDLEGDMKDRGFDKPWQILRSKWKALKQKYLSEKRNLSKSGAGGKSKVKLKYFDLMDEILGQRPIVSSMNSVLNSIGKANIPTPTFFFFCHSDITCISLVYFTFKR